MLHEVLLALLGFTGNLIIDEREHQNSLGINLSPDSPITHASTFKLEENDFTWVVFEGKFYEADQFKELENMPTRAKIYAKLLGTLKSPSEKVVETIQAPTREVVMVLKAFVKKLEDEQQGFD